MGLNDPVLTAIAGQYGDKTTSFPSPDLPVTVSPVVVADDYRRKLVQVRELGIADGVADTKVIIRLRPTEGRSWLVIRADWENQQVAQRALIDMRTERTDPAVIDYRNDVGQVTVGFAQVMPIIGQFSFDRAFAPVNPQMIPKNILVPAGAELRFDMSEPGGAILNAGAQILQMTMLEIPPQQSWDRFRAQTVQVI